MNMRHLGPAVHAQAYSEPQYFANSNHHNLFEVKFVSKPCHDSFDIVASRSNYSPCIRCYDCSFICVMIIHGAKLPTFELWKVGEAFRCKRLYSRQSTCHEAA